MRDQRKAGEGHIEEQKEERKAVPSGSQEAASELLKRQALAMLRTLF